MLAPAGLPVALVAFILCHIPICYGVYVYAKKRRARRVGSACRPPAMSAMHSPAVPPSPSLPPSGCMLTLFLPCHAIPSPAVLLNVLPAHLGAC